MSRRKIERIAAIVSIVSFGGSILVGGVQAIVTAMNQSQATPQPITSARSSPEPTPKSVMQIQEKEYELVLNKEPSNQTALEGLVNIRLQMQNYKGAVQPLKKLAQIEPNKQEYKTLLTQLNQRQPKMTNQ
ncbi:hypothetical protein C7B80_12175 [Cyanosarcina cf. burmensis CCALA 770]|nr:hypothetical protein C7B80_12175 [Cyanosarcina cf. burmensis CCALA 770]